MILKTSNKIIKAYTNPHEAILYPMIYNPKYTLNQTTRPNRPAYNRHISLYLSRLGFTNQSIRENIYDDKDILQKDIIWMVYNQ